MAVRFAQREASASRVANGIKKSPGFNKNIKKLGSLIMGKGAKTNPIYYINFILAYIYIINIRDTPLSIKKS